MRNKERISRIMQLVQKIWEQHPDNRFMQLMDNLQHEFCREHPAYKEEILVTKQLKKSDISSQQTYTEKMSHIDLFYVEDEEFERFLESYLQKVK